MVSIVDIIQRLFMVAVVVLFIVSVVAGNDFLLYHRRFSFYGFRRRRKGFLMVSVAGLLMDSAVAGGSIILECIE